MQFKLLLEAKFFAAEREEGCVFDACAEERSAAVSDASHMLTNSSMSHFRANACRKRTQEWPTFGYHSV